MKKINIWAVGLLLFASLSATAWAAEVVQPAPDQPDVMVGSMESHKNLYTGGATVTINGKTAGDLTAAGGTINISGDVEQEALVAGGTINISGNVGSHARIAGGNINISGAVKGDLVAAGGTINISGTTGVGGDLLVAGGSVNVDAPVAGNINAVGGSLVINNKVGGNIYARTSQTLVFGPNAEVKGSIVYKGPALAQIKAGAQVGDIQFTEVQGRSFRTQLAALVSLGFLIKILALMAAGWLMLRFRRHTVLQLSESVQSKPWENLGWGLLGLLIPPFAALILLLLFVGYYVAAVVAVAYVLMLILAKILAALVLGFWLLRVLHKTGEPLVDWQAVVIGAVLWSVLGFIPVLGWIILGLLFLMTLGALTRMVKTGMKPS